MLGTRPSPPTLVRCHLGAADGHRGRRHGNHASGLIPLHAGGLEGGDPGDVR